MDFQQSKTYQNLQTAYQSDLAYSTMLLINADTARIEGYEEIATIFDITAKNEKEHARIWQRNLNNGQLPTTEQNLLSSSNEALSNGDLYREYARIAREEGYNDIASLFNGVANIELNHNLRFRTLYDLVARGEYFCRPTETLWICMQCGNIMSGTCAPAICPVCGFPQGFYRIYDSEII